MMYLSSVVGNTAQKGVTKMKTEKFSGTIESAYGNPVSPALKFDGTFDAFESLDEIRQANEHPSNDEIVAFVNNKRKANARQKSMQAALDAAGYVKPTLESDVQLQLRTLIKVFEAAGKSRDEAVQIAETTLGAKLAA
jgi:hypothetical protein